MERQQNISYSTKHQATNLFADFEFENDLKRSGSSNVNNSRSNDFAVFLKVHIAEIFHYFSI